MNIPAGTMIQEALEAQRFKDLLRVMVLDFLAMGDRIERKLRAKGWSAEADLAAESNHLVRQQIEARP